MNLEKKKTERPQNHLTTRNLWHGRLSLVRVCLIVVCMRWIFISKWAYRYRVITREIQPLKIFMVHYEGCQWCIMKITFSSWFSIFYQDGGRVGAPIEIDLHDSRSRFVTSVSCVFVNLKDNIHEILYRPISQTNNPRFDNALDHIVAFIFSPFFHRIP